MKDYHLFIKLTRVAIPLIILITSACGGGASKESDNDIDLDLSLGLIYPTPGSNLGGALSTRVSGRVTSDNGREFGPSDIINISVNDVLAELDIDDSGIWSAIIPLQAPDQIIEISLTYGSNQSEVLSYEVKNKPVLGVPADIVLDDTNRRVLIADSQQQFVLEIDLDTGTRRVIATLPDISASIFESSVIALGDQVLYFFYNEEIHQVDLDSGNQSILTGGDIGSGPTISYVTDMVFDEVNDQLLLTQSPFDFSGADEMVMAINLSTGNRTELSGPTRGDGPQLENPKRIVLDGVNERLFIADSSFGGVMSIDTSSGDREILFQSIPGVYEGITFPTGIAFDGLNDRVLLVDNLETPTLYAFALDGGALPIVLSTDSVGEGIEFSSPSGLAFDSENNQVLVADRYYTSFITVDPQNGNRDIYDVDRVGAGPDLQVPESSIFDIEKNRALIVDNRLEALIEVDLGNGNRSIISDSGNGNGPQLENPTHIVIHGDFAYVSDWGTDAIYKISTENGDRELLTSEFHGYGPEISNPGAMQLDLTNNRLLVLVDESAIYSVDLTSGERVHLISLSEITGVDLEYTWSFWLDVVSDRLYLIDGFMNALVSIDIQTAIGQVVTGSGVEFISPYGIAFDSSSNHLLVSDEALRGIIAVDLETGERSLLSGLNVGLGQPFTGPFEIAVDPMNRRSLVTQATDVTNNRIMIMIDNETGNRAIVTN